MHVILWEADTRAPGKHYLFVVPGISHYLPVVFRAILGAKFVLFCKEGQFVMKHALKIMGVSAEHTDLFRFPIRRISAKRHPKNNRQVPI